MSFDNYYPNRKDRRKPFRKSKVFDVSCRCHGGCSYCFGNRNYSNKKRLLEIEYQIKHFDELVEDVNAQVI